MIASIVSGTNTAAISAGTHTTSINTGGVAGSKCLFVSVHERYSPVAGQPFPTATFNGVAMTRLGSVDNNSGSTTLRVSIFYLVNPANNTHNLVVSDANANIINVCYLCLKGVSAIPIANSNGNNQIGTGSSYTISCSQGQSNGQYAIVAATTTPEDGAITENNGLTNQLTGPMTNGGAPTIPGEVMSLNYGYHTSFTGTETLTYTSSYTDANMFYVGINANPDPPSLQGKIFNAPDSFLFLNSPLGDN